MDYRIISIGAPARNELWGERTDVRTAHGTTVLVRHDKRALLIDPGLPEQVIAARLGERAGITADQITDVFLTSFRPSRRMGLGAFPNATWLIAEMEREAVGRHLVETLGRADDDETREVLQREIALLKRCKAAPDRIMEQVDLFPLPGVTPGTCGLLLAMMNATVLLAGEAVPTIEHLEQGRIPRDAFDAEQAQESFMEAVEIADLIVPGYDNITINRTRHPY